MSLIYQCDRCGASSGEPMPHVCLAISKRGSDFSLPQDLAAKSPMLCQVCAQEVQRVLCEQLPRSA